MPNEKSRELATAWTNMVGPDHTSDEVLVAACALMASIINATVNGKPERTTHIFERVSTYTASIIREEL